MPDYRYFVYPNGEGPGGPGSPFLGQAIRRLRRRLHRNEGPYHYAGHERQEWKLEDILKDAKHRMATHKPPLKLVIRGTYYDQMGYAIKSMDVAPPPSAAVQWCQQFVGRSPYSLGAQGPPGPSDCSGMTSNAMHAAFGISIEHNADAQYRDPRMRIFHNATDLEPGDFVFFNYGRLSAGQADHVEFFARTGVNIGSRPSTNGVNYYRWTSHAQPDSSTIAYGRLGG